MHNESSMSVANKSQCLFELEEALIPNTYLVGHMDKPIIKGIKIIDNMQEWIYHTSWSFELMFEDRSQLADTKQKNIEL